MVRLQLLFEAVFRTNPTPPSQNTGVIDKCVQGKIFRSEFGREPSNGSKTAQVEAANKTNIEFMKSFSFGMAMTS